VVSNERRLSVENSNPGLLQEQLLAAAFNAHPYHWPVIGWMSDIQTWKREDLMDYYKLYYAPNNCEMVIVGDIQPDQVLRLAREYLEPIPPQPAPPPVTTREPEQQGERRVTLHKFAQLPLLQVAFHSPAAADPDFVPLDVLERILLKGESSRLYQRLVDKQQVAIGVGGGQSPHFDPFLFELDVQPRDGVAIDRIEQLLYEELGRVQATLVEERELQKAKNNAVAEFYRAMRTIDGKANALGTYDVIFGDYRKLYQTVDTINRVTRGDVQRVARKYLNARNRTVAILVPEKPADTPAGKEQP
jgi:zinc protease